MVGAPLFGGGDGKDGPGVLDKLGAQSMKRGLCADVLGEEFSKPRRPWLRIRQKVLVHTKAFKFA